MIDRVLERLRAGAGGGQARRPGRPLSRVGGALVVITVLAALPVWAYWPGLSGGLYFDDLQNIVEAPALHWEGPTWQEFRQGASGARLPRRVVANVTLGLNHAWGGLEPRGYHLVNLAIHLLVGAALVWVGWLYAAGSGRPKDGGGSVSLAAAAASLLFLVHPLNVQSVTYVVQRMTSLAALFGLVAFGAYLAGRRGSGRGVWGWFALAGASWLLAAGSKETALVMPAVVIAYELSFHGSAWRRRFEGWWSEGRGRRAVLVAAAGLLVAGWLLGELYVEAGDVHWGERLPNREYSGWERMLTQARVQILYLGLLLWPDPGRLTLEHQFAVSRSWLEPATLGSIGFWLAAVGAVVWLVHRRPRYGFPLLAYLLLHGLESGPVNLELVFEHRMYLPLAFLALLPTVMLSDLGARRRWMALALALLAALPLAGATHSRNVVWSDPITLHYDCARKAPEKFRPQLNLGTHLGRAGRYAEAVPVLRRALSLRPDSSEAHNQLGSVYLSTGDLRAALEAYRKAVELDAENAEAVFNLAMALEQSGHYPESAENYRRFLELAPPYLDHARPRAEASLGWLSSLPVQSEQPR